MSDNENKLNDFHLKRHCLIKKQEELQQEIYSIGEEILEVSKSIKDISEPKCGGSNVKD